MEEIKDLSDKIEKHVSGELPVAVSVDETVSVEVHESSSVPEITKALNAVTITADDASGAAEMKDHDPTAVDLSEAVVEQIIDTFGAAIADAIQTDQDREIADACAALKQKHR